MAPDVRILLALHRPGPFLDEQMRSITNQRNVTTAVTYYIDDHDHSPDGFSGMHPDLTHLTGPPGLGLPEAYFQLLRGAEQDAPFWAFADQDDIWLPGKLATAVARLRELDPKTPTLWICRVRPFRDGDPDVWLPAFPRGTREPSLGNALVEGVGPGCAMVWNAALHRMVVATLPKKGALLHDTWMYLVASALGKIVVEPEPLVAYRLHAGNAIGINTSPLHRLRRLRERNRHPERPSISSQAEAFLDELGGNLSPQQLVLVDALAHRRRRLLCRLWLRGLIHRQRPLENLALPMSLATLPRRGSKAEVDGAMRLLVGRRSPAALGADGGGR